MLMEEENIYNDIQKIFENMPGNFNILEEQIDLEVQMKYFERSKELKEANSGTDFLAEGKKYLFSSETASDRKKEILIGLGRNRQCEGLSHA
jgi:hypothetical protein